jgi:peptide/nickel transport system permease protein
MVTLALTAPLLARLTGYGFADQDRAHGVSVDGLPVAPSLRHLLGTDQFGRDILVRLVYGARVSLLVGVASTVLAVVLGVVAGLVAGYYGGALDDVLGRLADFVLAFPGLLLVITLASVVGPSLVLSVLVIAAFSWAVVARIIRGEVLSMRERDFVLAARVLGAGAFRIMFVEMLPNLIAPIIAYSTLLVPSAIVFEATLSFLGLDVVPPTPTWGNLLAESTPYYEVAWWYALFPGTALLLTAVAFNQLGDAIRDAIDTRSDVPFLRATRA